MFADFVPDPEEALLDAHWILRLGAALAIQIGLLRLLAGQPYGAHLAAGGLALFFVCFTGKFAFRMLLVCACALFLIADFAARRNPFSIVFALPFLWHAVLLVLSRGNPVPPAEKT